MYALRFARLYDELTGDYDYGGWAAHYVELAKAVGGREIGSVCECGCGTGSMSLRFAEAGFKVTGVDISPGMLEVASEKLRESGLKALFTLQDMRELRLTKPVDAIFGPCDGVNYLTGAGDLRAFFGSAYRWLKPGGALAFDVSTPEKLRAMAGQVYFEDRENVSYFWRNEMKGDVLKLSLAFFSRRPGGLYERFDEEQAQKAHEMSDILNALGEAGFANARAFGETAMRSPAPGDQRWHFAAVRP